MTFCNRDSLTHHCTYWIEENLRYWPFRWTKKWIDNMWSWSTYYRVFWLCLL